MNASRDPTLSTGGPALTRRTDRVCVIIIVCALVAGAVVHLQREGGSAISTPPTGAALPATRAEIATPELDDTERGELFLRRLAAENDQLGLVRTEIHLGDRGAILGLVGQIDRWAALLDESTSQALDADGVEAVQAFRDRLVEFQSRALPRLRDAWGPALRARMSESGRSARTIGAGFRALELTDPGFENGETIDRVHALDGDAIRRLRFDTVRYRTARTSRPVRTRAIDGPPDDAPIAWSGRTWSGERAGTARPVNLSELVASVDRDARTGADEDTANSPVPGLSREQAYRCVAHGRTVMRLLEAGDRAGHSLAYDRWELECGLRAFTHFVGTPPVSPRDWAELEL